MPDNRFKKGWKDGLLSSTNVVGRIDGTTIQFDSKYFQGGSYKRDHASTRRVDQRRSQKVKAVMGND